MVSAEHFVTYGPATVSLLALMMAIRATHRTRQCWRWDRADRNAGKALQDVYLLREDFQSLRREIGKLRDARDRLRRRVYLMERSPESRNALGSLRGEEVRRG